MSVDVHTLSGAYALNAVDDLERAAFNRHAAECETCAEEVAGLTAAVSRLADSTWSVAPPAMRDRVLSQISQTRQLRPGPERSGKVTPSRWRTRVAAAAAAVVLVAGAATGTYFFQQDRVSQEQDRVAAGRQQLAAIQDVLTASDAVLRRGDLANGGALSLAVSRQADAAVATVSGAPAPGAGQAYEFWRMRDGKPVPAGLLGAGQADGSLLISDIRAADGIAVSVEPSTGSPQPTTDPVGLVRL